VVALGLQEPSPLGDCDAGQALIAQGLGS